MSGSALISNNQYTSGEFEFKITPQMTDGIVTVFGLSNDGTQISAPYY
jgi:hypothetical protein